MEDIILNKKFKVLSRFDLGWTEDEYNNFIIDLFAPKVEDEIKSQPISSICGKPVTITITKDNLHS